MFLLAFLSLLQKSLSDILAIDLGNQFYKIVLISPGRFDIVQSTSSKRKSLTAVSYLEFVRKFGDYAYQDILTDPLKVAHYFVNLIGKDKKALDGLGKISKFLTHNLSETPRQTLAFKNLSPDGDMTVEEVTAALLQNSKDLAEAEYERSVGKLNEISLVLPVGADLRTRQIYKTIAEIANFKVVSLFSEISSIVVQRAVDVKFEETDKNTPPKDFNVLYVNIGAFHTDACFVNYAPVENSANKSPKTFVPQATVLGCANSKDFSGMALDTLLADHLTDLFLKKFKLNALENVKAKTLVFRAAQKLKHDLSIAKSQRVFIEKLYKEKSFDETIKKETFENLLEKSGLLKNLKDLISEAFVSFNKTAKDIDDFEVVGNAWRVPKVHEFLADLFTKEKGGKISLSQHLNGDEAAVFGAGFLAANFSSSFRVKKIHFSEPSNFLYSLALQTVDGSWAKEIKIFEKGAKLGTKKTLKINQEKDLLLVLKENEKELDQFRVVGIEKIIKDHQDKKFQFLSLRVKLDQNGLIVFDSAEANFEFSTTFNETIKIPVNTTVEEIPSNSTETPPTPFNRTAADQTETAAESAAKNTTKPTQPKFKFETVERTKINKVRKAVKIVFEKFLAGPIPMGPQEIENAKKRLKAHDQKDKDAQFIDAARNEIESFIYSTTSSLKLDEETPGEDDFESLRPFVDPMEIEKLKQILQSAGVWLENDSKKSDLETTTKYLKNLKEQFRAADERRIEFEERSSLSFFMKRKDEQITKILNEISENKKWVNKTEVDELKNNLKNLKEEMLDLENKQKARKPYETPAYKASEVKEKFVEVLVTAEKLNKTKEPKKKKEPKKSTKDEIDDLLKKFREQNKDLNSTEFENLFKNLNESKTAETTGTSTASPAEPTTEEKGQQKPNPSTEL